MELTIEALERRSADALTNLWCKVRGRERKLPRTAVALGRILAEYFDDMADRLEARTTLG